MHEKDCFCHRGVVGCSGYKRVRRGAGRRIGSLVGDYGSAVASEEAAADDTPVPPSQPMLLSYTITADFFDGKYQLQRLEYAFPPFDIEHYGARYGLLNADGKPEPVGWCFVDRDGKRVGERYDAITRTENPANLLEDSYYDISTLTPNNVFWVHSSHGKKD